MIIKELSNKNNQELQKELLSLLREQFNLRMRAASGQLQQTHLLRIVRNKIAIIKTFLTKNPGI